MPLFILFFLIFTLANIAVPGTSGFICEFLTFLAAFNLNPFVGFLSSIAIVLAPAYSLWFFHKISYGSLSPHLTSIYSDIILKEFHILLPLLILTLFLGFYPNFILNTIQMSCISLLYIPPINMGGREGRRKRKEYLFFLISYHFLYFFFLLYGAISNLRL